VTAGFAAATANSFLNVKRNVAYAAIATPFVQLHTGDPGAAGTTAVAAVTTRNAITWNAASGGSMTLATLGAFTGVSSETITHVSIWTASTAGTFIESWALTAGVPIIAASTLTFSSFTLALTPVAA
jgi:hypothetical protein